MPLPRPRNASFKGEDIEFAVEVDGRTWSCFITSQALDELFPNNTDKLKALAQSSFVTRKAVERIRAGDVEPIVLTSLGITQPAAPVSHGGQTMSLTPTPQEWTVTSVYVDGPLDGDSQTELLSSSDPETVEIGYTPTRTPDGREWTYTVRDRKIDREARRAVLTLEWVAIDDIGRGGLSR